MKKYIILIIALLICFLLLYFFIFIKLDKANNELSEDNGSREVFQETDQILDFDTIVNLDKDDQGETEISYILNDVVDDLNNSYVLEEDIKKDILLDVPFIVQAPLGNWSDPRQQDACEEAGVLMAMAWVKGDKEPSLLEAERQIIALADWQQEKYGEHRDLHIEEVADYLFREYFSYNQVKIKEVFKVEELITFLDQGYLILAPSNGQALKNPYFSAPGPERHLLVIIGYDYNAKMFITNDPGTRHGRSFRYSKEILFEAIRVYPSGYHEPITSEKKLILLVSK